MRSRLAIRLLPALALIAACAGPGGRVDEAEVFYAKADYFQAYRRIEEIREAYPDDPSVQQAYWKLRLAFLLWDGQQRCFANDEAAAIRNFEKALVLDPGNEIAERWILKCRDKLAQRAADQGDRLRTFGDLEGALRKYHESLSYQPGNPTAEAGLQRLAERWARTQDEAQSHYLQGVRALAEQLFKQTRYHLLIALDKDPTLEQAVAPSEQAHRLLTEERFAEAQRMEEEGYYGPALREYRAIRSEFPDFAGIDERIERAGAENRARELSDQGEMAVYRGEYAKARELLQQAFDLTEIQKDAISERLLLVHEREVTDRYFAAKDLELQHELEEALAAYRQIDQDLPGFEDVRARMGDLEIRIEESKKAYEAGLEAEQNGDLDAAIQSYGDVLLYWPDYRDARERLERLRAQKAGQSG
jgi:tetratricopeptide (TPR) repeat protein